jgi:ABC-type proline/glycine betaine transport system ATPase subunit
VRAGAMLQGRINATIVDAERAFVFKDFALMPWATFLRNVAFGLELKKVPKNERNTRGDSSG